MPKPKRGKPRRGKHLAEVSTVAVDPETKAILQREFGSLGNALFFTARGIEKYRKKHGMATHGSFVPDDPIALAGGLTFRDYVRIRDVFWHRVDRWRGKASGIAQDTEILRLVEAMILGSGVYRDLPGIEPVEGPEPRSKASLRHKRLGVEPVYRNAIPACRVCNRAPSAAGHECLWGVWREPNLDPDQEAREEGPIPASSKISNQNGDPE